MNKKIEFDIKEKIPRNRLAHCPHCKARTQCDLVFPSLYKDDRDISAGERSTYVNRYGTTFVYSIWKCRACGRLLFRVTKHEKYRDPVVLAEFPSGVWIDADFDDVVSPDVLEDFRSALKCFEFGEYRASAAMARRCLQTSILEFGAASSESLFGQIDSLHTKRPDRFTKDIKDWAHEIRLFGNWGAHPDEDGLKDVDKDTAAQVIDFLKAYFEYVYKLPREVENARKKRLSKEKPS